MGVGEEVGKRNPHTLVLECQLVQRLWKTVWSLLKKLKVELPFDPAILLLGIYLKECKPGYNKSTCTPYLLQYHSQHLSYGNSQDVPLLINGLRKFGIIYNGILFSLKEE
jgi:hypothetical protein